MTWTLQDEQASVSRAERTGIVREKRVKTLRLDKVYSRNCGHPIGVQDKVCVGLV